MSILDDVNGAAFASSLTTAFCFILVLTIFKSSPVLRIGGASYKIPKSRTASDVKSMPSALLVAAFALFLPVIIIMSSQNTALTIPEGLNHFPSKLLATFVSGNSQETISTPGFSKLAAAIPYIDPRSGSRGTSCGKDRKCFDFVTGNIVQCPGYYTGRTFSSVEQTIPNTPWFFMGFYDVCGQPQKSCKGVGTGSWESNDNPHDLSLYCKTRTGA